MTAISGARGRRRSGDCMAATAGSDKWLRAALERCWDRRRWLMWIPLVIPLLPLALGQGWIGEVVFILLVFVGAPDGLSYFFPFIMDHTRMLVAFPFAVALLTPWPEWVIAALIVASWLLVAGITHAVASRLFPNDATASMLAFFLAGVSAYDISLLHAGYVQLLVASLLHWAGMLALLMYCERKSMASLLGSTALQALSIAVYATAFPAIAVGPFVAFAILSSRSGYRAAIRPAAAIAIAWWALVAVYLLALAWVAKQPGAYITAGGGLTMSAPLQYLSLVVQLVASNFDPASWLHPVPQFGDPPRLIAPLLVWVISGVAALTMIPLVIGAFRADRGAPGLADARWVLGSLLLAVVVSNMATALLQSAGMNFRTHLVSRLYAALIIAALAATGVRSSRWWIRGLAAIALLAFLSIGAWTVADRTTYLASIWPRHRTELQSLDLAVRKIEPSAGIVLYIPSGAGYTATVAPWHAIPWLALIRGAKLPRGRFALWSPDRGADCETRGAVLHCHGDQQPAVDIPLEQLVLLRYDIADCRFKLVDGDWVGKSASVAPAEYAPRRLISDQPVATSRIFGQLLHGPQGLGRNVHCQ